MAIQMAPGWAEEVSDAKKAVICSDSVISLHSFHTYWCNILAKILNWIIIPIQTKMKKQTKGWINHLDWARQIWQLHKENQNRDM